MLRRWGGLSLILAGSPDPDSGLRFRVGREEPSASGPRREISRDPATDAQGVVLIAFGEAVADSCDDDHAGDEKDAGERVSHPARFIWRHEVAAYSVDASEANHHPSRSRSDVQLGQLACKRV